MWRLEDGVNLFTNSSLGGRTGLSQDDAPGYEVLPSAVATNAVCDREMEELNQENLRKKVRSLWLRSFPGVIFVASIDD